MSNDQPAQPTAVQQPPAPYSPAAPSAPGYPPQPGQPYGYAPATNTLAIVALVLAFFVSVAGLVCGYIALGQIKRTGEAGHGLALAAVIVSWAFIGLSVLFVVAYIVILASIFGAVAVGSASSGY